MHPHLHNVIALEHMADLARAAEERRQRPALTKAPRPHRRRPRSRRGLKVLRPAV